MLQFTDFLKPEYNDLTSLELVKQGFWPVSIVDGIIYGIVIAKLQNQFHA